MSNKNSLGTAYPLTTEAFAALHLVQPRSVRARVRLTGSYWGVEPKRLLNGRLAWPAVQVGA